MADPPARPRLAIGWTPVEVALEAVALVGIAASWIVALLAIPDLPAEVPVHFGASGRPDAFGPRATIWLLPAVATALYLTMTAVSRVPHLYNYPWPITAANAERQYRLGRTLIVVLKVWVVGLLFGIEAFALAVAQGRRDALPTELLLMVAGLAAIFLVYFVAAARRR